MSGNTAQTVCEYKIQMFGGFRMEAEGAVITDSVNRTHQVWNLLEYLVANRGKSVSQDELIEILWPNGDSFSPSNALKNLIYRIRTILQEYNIPNARDVVKYSRGSYSWNDDYPCVVDTEEFERQIKKADDQRLSDDARIECLRGAIDLYQGDFLPASSYEQWVVPLSGYYRSLYLKGVYKLCDLLIARERYEDVVNICEKAISVDQFEERAHGYLIYALINQNKQTAALQHYNYVTDLFYRELGVKPSEAMRSLYREITKSVSNMETDLGVIMEDLDEQNAAKGAFCCDYEVFKNMYRLEARSAARTGQVVFIALLTVTRQDNSIPEPKLLAKVMDQLLTSIRDSLRRGDVVARFSGTQYVLMLPTLTLENGQMVIDRIIHNFRANQRFSDYKIHTMLQPLDAVQ